MKTPRYLPLALLGASGLCGCTTYVVYDGAAEFQYRVAHLESIPLESAAGQGGASSATVAFEPASSHGASLSIAKVGGRPGLAAPGDGLIRMTPPPGTTSIGFTTYAAKSGAAGPVLVSLEGEPSGRERSITIPPPDADGASFLGIVSHIPITRITAPGPISGVSLERRK